MKDIFRTCLFSTPSRRSVHTTWCSDFVLVQDSTISLTSARERWPENSEMRKNGEDHAVLSAKGSDPLADVLASHFRNTR